MKKSLALFLTLLMLLSLVACSKNKNNETAQNDEDIIYTEAIVPVQTGENATAPGTVLLDTPEFKMIFDGFGVKNNLTHALVTVENKIDKALSISTSYISIDGYLLENLYFDFKVPGKAKENAELMYLVPSDSPLSFNQCFFEFNVYQPEGNTLLLFQEPITVAMGNAPYNPDYKGEQLLNTDHLRINFISEKDTEDGKFFYFLIENKSSKNLTIMIEDATVNGQVYDPYGTVILKSGHKVSHKIAVIPEFLEEHGINSVDQLEITFLAYAEGIEGYFIPETYVKVK